MRMARNHRGTFKSRTVFFWDVSGMLILEPLSIPARLHGNQLSSELARTEPHTFQFRRGEFWVCSNGGRSKLSMLVVNEIGQAVLA